MENQVIHCFGRQTVIRPEKVTLIRYADIGIKEVFPGKIKGKTDLKGTYRIMILIGFIDKEGEFFP